MCFVDSGLCDELLTCSEESYSVCVCGIVCDVETSAEAVLAQFRLLRRKHKAMLYSGCSYSVYICSELGQGYRTNIILFQKWKPS